MMVKAIVYIEVDDEELLVRVIDKIEKIRDDNIFEDVEISCFKEWEY